MSLWTWLALIVFFVIAEACTVYWLASGLQVVHWLD